MITSHTHAEKQTMFMLLCPFISSRLDFEADQFSN